MLKLGITGGIGSGKTTVCKIFEHLNVPIYYADERAKWLVNNHQNLKKDIIHHFGETSFIDGKYNRAYIADIVFKDKEKLNLLNQAIHPYVFEDWNKFCFLNSEKPLIIKEAAIMLETESKNTVDKIALVYSPIELRIERIKKRDRLDENQILKRMDMQMSDEEKMQLADYIIYNDLQHSLIDQVNDLYHKLIAIS
ncbi:MAG: dephospho-CoA kinase [Bacteroidota bacterium]|nr:dephospho-CoA kinase [Bacteroidota bacterium]